MRPRRTDVIPQQPLSKSNVAVDLVLAFIALTLGYKIGQHEVVSQFLLPKSPEGREVGAYPGSVGGFGLMLQLSVDLRRTPWGKRFEATVDKLASKLVACCPLWLVQPPAPEGEGERTEPLLRAMESRIVADESAYATCSLVSRRATHYLAALFSALGTAALVVIVMLAGGDLTTREGQDECGWFAVLGLLAQGLLYYDARCTGQRSAVVIEELNEGSEGMNMKAV